ncbi:Uncharacterised protein [Legionella busanensis]|uniref:Sugar-specific transcriptional regulator TrmB n=1 Tax=Legionella busanensis TaxID=190655 RepID=A0A378KDP5_9GAMM|nr:hypothetical protein [Legionella busanensis]STX81342.1 Uncharacterised protein [Legionella busanensis]
MGNLCSIFHAHFSKLVEYTRSHNKAVFLDKCIFWWQISKYTLNDGEIWFTRTLTQMATDLSLSERSISRYLEEFEQKGFIERVCKLSASTKNGFRVTKRLYIRVTQKLLDLVQIKEKTTKTIDAHATSCSFLNQIGEIEKDKKSVFINKEKDHNHLVNSTVSFKDNVEKLSKSLNNQKNYPIYQVEKVIGERVEERTKNYIKSMMNNLKQAHLVHFSSPEQTFAEIIFTITNQPQLKHVETIQHKVQIIAKLLREKRWRTPKGFYNHADYGQYFKQTSDKLIVDINEQNLSSLMTSNSEKSRVLKQKRDALGNIQLSIHSEKRYLEMALQEQQNGIDKKALLTSIKRQLTQLEEEASSLTLDIMILEQESAPTFKKGADILREKTLQLNQFQDKANILRLRISQQFEKLCETIKLLPKGHKDIDRQQQIYENLQSELIMLENTISELEFDLYASHVA